MVGSITFLFYFLTQYGIDDVKPNLSSILRRRRRVYVIQRGLNADLNMSD